MLIYMLMLLLAKKNVVLASSQRPFWKGGSYFTKAVFSFPTPPLSPPRAFSRRAHTSPRFSTHTRLDYVKLQRISLATSSARVFLPLLCHKGNTSVAKRIRLLPFRRAFAKRESFLLKFSKWELLGVVIKKRERRKRNINGMLIINFLTCFFFVQKLDHSFSLIVSAVAS